MMRLLLTGKAVRRVAFHNLKFDAAFLLHWLFDSGYKHTEDRPGKGEFSTLISADGMFYSVKVCHGAHKGSVVEFWDSLKRIPLPVSAIPKAFKFDDVSKGDIDYNAPRPLGYEPTVGELDYLRRDVEIVARALHVQTLEGMSKLTVGADALADFKRLHSKTFWNNYFPLIDVGADTLIRKAYKGGFTYADPRFAKRVVGPVSVFDVNSLYPSVMYNRPLPYGLPLWEDGAPRVTPERPLYIARIVFTAKLKPNHIPCIQLKGSSRFGGTEYLSVVDEPTEVWVSSVDLDLWRDHYDVNVIQYGGYFSFMARTGLFNSYIDKWGAIKANSDGGRRTIAKLFLNSLYGKLATNPDCTGMVPTLVNGRLKYVRGTEETRDPVYTPGGVFITAWARDVTIRAAQAHYDIFAYADTDSLHLVTDTLPDDLDIDPNRLGAWKHEGNFDQAFYGRAKCYTEHRHGELPGSDGECCSGGVWDTHIAGLPRSLASSVRFADYGQPTHFMGKLTPKQVPGGVVLDDVGFWLRV